MKAPINILLVDNYDSFSFNLVHQFEVHENVSVTVRRPHEIEVSEFYNFTHLVFSPGPGLPSASEKLMQLLSVAIDSGLPVLGVCLGHQGLAQATGGDLRNLDEVYHGVSHELCIADELDPIFAGFSQRFLAGRYHSWVVNDTTLPAQWSVTCRDRNGEIMAMRHRKFPVFGIQFHPESILTPNGAALLQNFLQVKCLTARLESDIQLAG